MNLLEKKFYNHLIKNCKVKEEDIKFERHSSPDFKVNQEGKLVGYEVKPFKKTITIRKSQHKKIKKWGNETYLVLMKKYSKTPIDIVPYDKLKNRKTQRMGKYKIIIPDLYQKKVVSFIVKNVPSNVWDEFTNKIDRKIYDEKNDCYECQSVEKYLRELIIKISVLPREEINNLVKTKIKIIFDS